jgi:hypothetical protein
MRAILRRWTCGLPGRQDSLGAEHQRDSVGIESAVLRLGLLASALLLSAINAVTSPITGLFNTGVNSQGALLASGSADLHYSLIQSPDASYPGPSAFVVNDAGFPIPPWLTNGPNSKWIAPQANQTSGNQPGNYTYRINFDLTGLNPATASINGLWTSDNSGTAIILNGLNAAGGNDGNFRALSNAFSITTGFVDGTNTLDFIVNNATTSASPTGLRVEVSGTANPLPPPGTPPSILTPPASRTNAPGDSAGFNVRATGAPALSYQWRRNLNPISSATNSAYTIPVVAAADAGSYDVVVTNSWGMVTSAPPAVLTLSYPSPAELSYETIGPSSRRTALAITEIMYHPPTRADGRNTEFIEIYNSNPFAEDLSGYSLTGDWDYTFPNGTTIAGLGYLVVAASPADMQAVYGLAGVLGGTTNNLPNDSGTIRLLKRSGAVLLEINYSDQPPWPVAADGAGHSLVLARESFGENDPRAWAASAVIGGSPGAADPIPTGLLENVVINEFLAHTDPPDVDYIELYNHSTVPVDLSGCILTDDAATNKFVIPSGTTIPARGFVFYTETNLNFALSAAGETIYFMNPAHTRVLDVVRFEAQENGVASGRFPDGAEQFYRLAAKTPGATNAPIRVSQVVINELMYDPISGNDDDQYVELYNRGSTPVNLGGWQLSQAISFTFPSNTVVAPDGYLVVGKNVARLRTNYSNLNANNSFGNFSGKLSHNGERLTLTLPETTVSINGSGLAETNTIHVAVDDLTYGTGGRWGQWAAGGGSSLELIDPRSNHRLASNWADSDETAKAGWTAVENTGMLDLCHPSVTNSDQLQLFLQGPGEALVDNVEAFFVGSTNRLANSDFESGTNGWFFQGTQRLTSWETNGGYNSARSLHLRASDRGDQVADRVRAPFTASFPTGQVATLRAKVRWLRGWPEILIRFKGGHLEAIGQLAVPPNLGTPGARNSQALTNAGPAIYEVSHRPVLPPANQPIRVTARVEDPDGLNSIWVRYRIDPATNLFAVTMTDDGANGDLVAGDGVYTGLIPGQPADTLVAFRVEATDAFSPPATTQFPADAPVRECLVRVGETMPAGTFGTYRFWLTQTTFDFWSNREKTSNENVDSTFVYGTNRVFYNIGAHYSGSPYTSPSYTTPTGALCGYDLIFPSDDLMLGSDHLIFDWPIRDTTDQREQLMFWFLEQFGLPNNYRRYINLFVNGVQRGVIYDDIQQPGGDTVKEWFSNDNNGSLYKTDVWDEFNDSGLRIGSLILLNSLEEFTTTGGAKKVARYRWNWEPRAVNGTANDFSELFTLVDAVNAPTNGYESALNGQVDMDVWMKTFCMNDLASYWDAFGNPNAKNTYLYKPKNDRWKLMCWDFDVGLGVDNDPVDQPLFPTLNDPEMMRLEAYPAFVRRYWCALDQALNTFFKTGAGTALDALLDTKYAAFQTNGIALTSPSAIKTWISQRRAFLQTQLATVSASFAVNGTNYITTNRNTIILTGTAPVTAQTIMLNGVAYPISWTSVTSWRMVVPVTNGIQVLNLQGLDRLGQPVAGASAVVTVNYTGANELPEDSIVINEIMCQPSVADAAYLELFNHSTNYSFDISGWRVNGVGFTFPSGSVITNQQFLVLAKDQAAFGSAYGWGIPLAGIYDGTLQTDGETLTLFRPGANSANEIEVAKVRYDTAAPWPSGANGTGSSFQLLDPAQDNWRAGNWTVVPTNTFASPAPQWVYFATNGTASSSVIYIYLQSSGDIYVDDLNLVAGSVPDVGVNLITNAGFETTLTGTWTRTANFALSNNTTNKPHTGNFSLHVFATAAGTGNGNAISQTISPALVTNQPYALSFWYLQSTNGGPLTIRLSGSGLTSGSLTPAPSSVTTNVPPATPGAPNSIRPSLPAFPPLWLNEVQAENLTGITNRAGQRTPWVELRNPTTNSVSLLGLYLANNYANLTQWAFPTNAVILPGEFKVVFADGQTNLSTLSELHASFTLSPGSGQIGLSRINSGQPQVLDYLDYASLPANHSYGSYPDQQSFQRQEFFYPTPGASNNSTLPPLTVFINEWMADNTITLADPADNDFEDWFELYNPGATAMDLGGYYLTDTLTNKFQYQVPNNHQYVIPPHGFLLVWADNETKQNATNRADLHVNFKLDKAGEAIGLFAADGNPVDYVTFGPQASDVSMGRYPDGGASIYRLTVPTARTNNSWINSAPVLAPLSNHVLTLGQTLNFTASATDADSPPQVLVFSLAMGAPSAAAVNPASGLFSWTPATAPATNSISLEVSDNLGGPGGLSATQTFSVIVLPPPYLNAARLQGSQFVFFWPALVGQIYQVEYKTNLSATNWTPLGNPVIGAGVPLGCTNSSASSPQGYYRVRLVP